jgi:hypothetical protein
MRLIPVFILCGIIAAFQYLLWSYVTLELSKVFVNFNHFAKF